MLLEATDPVRVKANNSRSEAPQGANPICSERRGEHVFTPALLTIPNLCHSRRNKATIPMIATGSFTAGATGNKTVSLLPFTPKALRFKVSKPGFADNSIQFLAGGFTDGSTGRGFAIVNDSGSILTFEDSAKCLLAYDIVSGVVTKVLEATFVSFGTNKFTLNFTVASAVYQIQVDLLG